MWDNFWGVLAARGTKSWYGCMWEDFILLGSFKIGKVAKKGRRELVLGVHEESHFKEKEFWLKMTFFEKQSRPLGWRHLNPL